MGSQKPYYKRPKVVKLNEEELLSDSRPSDDSFNGGEYIDLWPLRQEIMNQHQDTFEKACSLVPKLHAVTIFSAIKDFRKTGFSNFFETEIIEGEPKNKDKLSPVALASLIYHELFNMCDDGKAGTVSEWKDFNPIDYNIPKKVSDTILGCTPGWCGTFGAEVKRTSDLLKEYKGDYDMNIMNLIPIAYRYFNELSPDASDKLIDMLMGEGRIRRIDLDDEQIAGSVHPDWHLAGKIKLSTELITKVPELISKVPGLIEKKIEEKLPIPDLGFKVADLGQYIPTVDVGVEITDIGETENHILMIATARYLTNQLKYQRTGDNDFDNRRNGGIEKKSCMEQVLYLLANVLKADFSEYNSKPYSRHTRTALINLHNYSYDHEVRLAAKIVLDYLSARIAVSSSDLRRMVPFRRRNEHEKGRVAQFAEGFMDVALLNEGWGADPMVARFALLSGNVRAFQTPSPFPPELKNPEANRQFWLFNAELSAVSEVISDYKLPTSIHHLLVNNHHRRFYQRLHRTPLDPINVTYRNCDNYEIYAASPSYLISAGGKPANYAIDPTIAGINPMEEGNRQQLGVAVTTSFIPTTNAHGGAAQRASELIQFSSFSDNPDSVENYGVAPDFAFGNKVYLPDWANDGLVDRKFHFVEESGPDWDRGVDKDLAGMESGPVVPGTSKRVEAPSFFLAIFKDGDYCILEAFDCWVHPGVSFEDFKDRVASLNPITRLEKDGESLYRTQNGNVIRYKIWSHGATVIHIDYGTGNPYDTLIGAGNDKESFLSGNVMNSPESGVVTISNPVLGTTITLDLSDNRKPMRISENGEIESAGNNNEVWVDFDWTGPCEGDFYRPFNTLAAAITAVAEGGTIKVMPGISRERINFQGKKFKLVAPIGEVIIGARRGYAVDT
jgi:hypothetical protein